MADTDTDEDGVADCSDLCPSDSAKQAPGACGCGTADTDGDGDGVPDCNDGCPSDSGKTVGGAWCVMWCVACVEGVGGHSDLS